MCLGFHLVHLVEGRVEVSIIKILGQQWWMWSYVWKYIWCWWVVMQVIFDACFFLVLKALTPNRLLSLAIGGLGHIRNCESLVWHNTWTGEIGDCSHWCLMRRRLSFIWVVTRPWIPMWFAFLINDLIILLVHALSLRNFGCIRNWILSTVVIWKNLQLLTFVQSVGVGTRAFK